MANDDTLWKSPGSKAFNAWWDPQRIEWDTAFDLARQAFEAGRDAEREYVLALLGKAEVERIIPEGK